MEALRSASRATAPWAQFFTQAAQPTQASRLISGFESECISSLPPIEPEPMPRFFSAPPKPVISCPLKWFSEITTSASAIAEPILAFFTCFRPISTSRYSVPRSPSAMMTSQPTPRRLKPFSEAARRWSTAFDRLPL